MKQIHQKKQVHSNYSFSVLLIALALFLTGCKTETPANVADTATPAITATPDITATPAITAAPTATTAPTPTPAPPDNITLNQLSDDDFYYITYHSDYDLDKLLHISTLDSASTNHDTDFQIMCSTFYAKTEEGNYITGRNFDYDQAAPIILVNDPKDGYDSISVTNLLFFGDSGKTAIEKLPYNELAMSYVVIDPLDGINEKGVSMSVMESSSSSEDMRSSGHSKVNAVEAIRLVLDRAATTQEAIDLLENYDIESSFGHQYHFLIGDATGHSVVIEYIDNEMVVIDNPDSYQACTNFVIQPYLESQATYFPCPRYNKMMDKLKKTDGILSIEDAQKLLFKVRQGTTKWSCVYNNTDCSLEISKGANGEQYYHIGFDDLNK